MVKLHVVQMHLQVLQKEVVVEELVVVIHQKKALEEVQVLLQKAMVEAKVVPVQVLMLQEMTVELILMMIFYEERHEGPQVLVAEGGQMVIYGEVADLQLLEK
ncbi:MAG: hypothetical protein B7Y25_08150 [Alphaproteobacteria bacterium 16-39-46]|nr:MAG: hypothetical protein B7Y25_08150 [Alphaproteobacteria bacterium 16-39-46]OZA41263.1 MAG: hypothetical protein B7X84_08280 [Alphaproteobacteria bacterium 17-39-52]